MLKNYGQALFLPLRVSDNWSKTFESGTEMCIPVNYLLKQPCWIFVTGRFHNTVSIRPSVLAQSEGLGYYINKPFRYPSCACPTCRISLPGYRSIGINTVYAVSVTEHFLSRNTLRRLYLVF
jgi:hypothetical protein